MIPMDTEWWETVFSGSWLDVQRRSRSEEQTAREADFIARVLQLQPRAEILDVPCGEGRISLALAAKGFSMTGVDLTLPLLEDAKLKAAERNLEITWEHRDMRDLPWTHTFDGAICFGGSFGFFDDCNNLKFVEAIFKTLKPGGKFFLDILAAEALFPHFQERNWHTAGDILVVNESRYDHVEGRVNTTWKIVQNGCLETKSSSVRIYTYHELHNLLKEIGFCRFEAYGSLDGDPFTLGSGRLYLVAVKP